MAFLPAFEMATVSLWGAPLSAVIPVEIITSFLTRTEPTAGLEEVSPIFLLARLRANLIYF